MWLCLRPGFGLDRRRAQTARRQFRLPYGTENAARAESMQAAGILPRFHCFSGGRRRPFLEFRLKVLLYFREWL